MPSHQDEQAWVGSVGQTASLTYSAALRSFSERMFQNHQLFVTTKLLEGLGSSSRNSSRGTDYVQQKNHCEIQAPHPIAPPSAAPLPAPPSQFLKEEASLEVLDDDEFTLLLSPGAAAAVAAAAAAAEAEDGGEYMALGVPPPPPEVDPANREGVAQNLEKKGTRQLILFKGRKYGQTKVIKLIPYPFKNITHIFGLTLFKWNRNIVS